MAPILLDVDELAETLGENRKTVGEWARNEVIPSIRVSGKRYFNLRKVVETIRERQQAERAEAAVSA